MGRNFDRVLQLARIFDAPRSLVFEAWIEPDHPRRWWEPGGSATLATLLESRPGGRWRICSRRPGGGQVVEQGVFHEVIRPERLLFGHTWTDAAGRPGPETLVTVRFAALGTTTKLTLRQEVFDTGENRDGHAQRWGERLDRLGKYLTTIRNRRPSGMPRPTTEGEWPCCFKTRMR
jgi:uncharacterized protein YndB with AHSA1/START domain